MDIAILVVAADALRTTWKLIVSPAVTETEFVVSWSAVVEPINCFVSAEVALFFINVTVSVSLPPGAVSTWM